MDGALKERTKFVDVRGVGYPRAKSAGTREVGEAAERQAIAFVRDMNVMQISAHWGTREGEVQTFESRDAMRFGRRFYTEEQLDLARTAATERDEPLAEPIPLAE